MSNCVSGQLKGKKPTIKARNPHLAGADGRQWERCSCPAKCGAPCAAVGKVFLSGQMWGTQADGRQWERCSCPAKCGAPKRMGGSGKGVLVRPNVGHPADGRQW